MRETFSETLRHRYTCLDTWLTGDNDLTTPDDGLCLWSHVFSRILDTTLGEELSSEVHSIGNVCISRMLQTILSQITEFVALAIGQVGELPVTRLDYALIVARRRAIDTEPSETQYLANALIVDGIQWAIKLCADENDASFDLTIEELSM